MTVVDPTIKEKDLNADAFMSQPASNPGVTATRVSGVDSDREVSDLPDNAPDGSVHVERNFYNPFDGTRGRLGGDYLDVKERVDAEERRAKSEKRKPDSNPPASTGTPLVTEELRVDNVFSNPSSAAVAPVKEVEPVSTLPVDVGIAKVNEDTTYTDQLLAENQARASSEEVPTEGPTPTAEQGGVAIGNSTTINNNPQGLGTVNVPTSNL